MKNLRNTRGFTLIELMIVVVIIGILAALAIPRFSNAGRQARSAEAPTLLKQLCTLANAQREVTGTYPAAIGDISAWQFPNMKYYTIAYAAGSASAAALTNADVETPVTMNCASI